MIILKLHIHAGSFMKEIADILKAYQKALKENKRTALATVVKVVGSSYRRPGARMLVTEDGQLTGAISGGCLEGDALRKALSAIHQQENKLVTYDTTDEDDAKLGIQLGCNGIVYILFEPVKNDETSPLALLSALESKRENSVLVTLFSMNGGPQPGTSILYRENGCIQRVPAVSEDIIRDAAVVLSDKNSSFNTYTHDQQEVEGFLEFISPPVALIIAGAGNDAQPLSEIADLLGWEVTIADGRPAHCTPQRFPCAGRFLVGKPDEIFPQIEIDEHTAFVLMTHNYNYDIRLLNLLLDSNAPYIGSLGPRTKLIRMLDELGRNSAENVERVHGPVGLDIGAETAEEIAVSIIAEIKAFFAGASAKKLKEKKSPIHYSEMRNN